MESKMYGQFASEYDDAVQDNIYNALLERPTLQSMLPALNNAKVLDLGCGSGVYAQYFFAQQAQSVTCIDYSSQMVELVKSKLSEHDVRAYDQDLSQGLPNETDNSYDLAVSPLMVHYLENLEPLFKDVARVLKPHGEFVFSTHHPFADFECSKTGNYFESEKVTETWNTVSEPLEVTFYRRSLSEITTALTNSGFMITALSEGVVSEEVKLRDPDVYHHLSRNPNFIFFRCKKTQ